MEVAFVLYDLLKKPCILAISSVIPKIKDATNILLLSFNQTFRYIFMDLLADYVFFFDWKYIFLLVFKTILANWIIIGLAMLLVYKYRTRRRNINRCSKQREIIVPCPVKMKAKYSIEEICNLIKNCQKPTFAKNLISLLDKYEIDVNATPPKSKAGITPFMCACIGGSKELVEYMLSRGGDINYKSKYNDSPLHIATFACATQQKDDFSVLVTLLNAGSKINSQNWVGNTPLCIAASYDNGKLIRFLISQGADASICNNDGVYPIDFASNAGNQHLTSLLRFKVASSHVWEFVEPHTPPHIKLGLQTPRKKHLADSSFINSSKRKLSTFRTPRSARSFIKDTHRKSRYQVDVKILQGSPF